MLRLLISADFHQTFFVRNPLLRSTGNGCSNYEEMGNFLAQFHRMPGWTIHKQTEFLKFFIGKTALTFEFFRFILLLSRISKKMGRPRSCLPFNSTVRRGQTWRARIFHHFVWWRQSAGTRRTDSFYYHDNPKFPREIKTRKYFPSCQLLNF